MSSKVSSRIARRLGVPVIAALALYYGTAAANGSLCDGNKPAPPAPDLRTVWGDPDLQGVWSGAETVGVPLDRDPKLGTRSELTDDEFEARKAVLIKNASATNIEATNFGADPEVAFTRSRQASLVVDPPNGQRPPLTPEAQARPPPRHSFMRGSFNTLADFGTFDRCIAFSTVPAAQPVNAVEIVQSPGYVAIRAELIHEARIVPLDGSAHLGGTFKSYAGDSRGHWEGRTLVVETTNFNGSTNLTGNAGGRPTDQLTVTERFTLVDENTLSYAATINDPGTWTQPWIVAFPRKRERNGALYEYACHEGNLGLRNILSAARAAEKETEKK